MPKSTEQTALEVTIVLDELVSAVLEGMPPTCETLALAKQLEAAKESAQTIKVAEARARTARAMEAGPRLV